MTKQEQIQEITKIINRRCEAELGQVHANSKDGKVTKTVDTSLIAKDIINAGYRKLDKDIFVLTKEDLKKCAKDCLIGEIAGLDILIGAFARGERIADEARKETAKEILQTLRDWANRDTPLIADIQELADKYGIELE